MYILSRLLKNRSLHVNIFIFRVIAEGTIPDPGSLKANDDTMLDVGVKVPHNVLVSLVKDIGADWDIDYELNIILTVDLPVVGNINIPVNSCGEIKLPTLSSLFGGGGSTTTV